MGVILRLLNFSLWRKYGSTPLWLLDYRRTSSGVCAILEQWAESKGIITTMENYSFAIGVDLITGEELDNVIRSVVNLLGDVSTQLYKVKGQENGREH